MIRNNSTTLSRKNSATFMAQASNQGSWQTLPYTSPILPINACLFYTGQPFFIAGSSNNPDNQNEPQGSAVWNISSGTFNRPYTPLDNGGIVIDLFCVGQSFLADGRLLVAGGTINYNPSFTGRQDALIFDPDSQQWTTVSPMSHGRWYPTLVTLGDGTVFTVSGFDENGSLNLTPEIYDPNADSWTAFPPTSPFQTYPHLFLLSDGTVFYSGGYMGGYTGVSPRTLTIPTDPTQPIQENPVPNLQNQAAGNQGASVMLPPVQQQQVMIIGGGDDYGSATNRVNIIDFTASNPTYSPANSLNYARQHCNAVLLPDRTVFVCGGSLLSENATQGIATLTAEIYDPLTGNWTPVASQQYPRLYHSTALLLPDGSVLSAGGNPQRRNQCNNNVDPSTGFICEELHLEIYSPAYMSASQPVIASADSSVTYGGTFNFQTAQPVNLQWVNLIAPMATTHSYESGQRVVDCPFTASDNSGTNFTATLTNNPNIAPPGWYMLFIVDQNRIPSQATWIQVTTS